MSSVQTVERPGSFANVKSPVTLAETVSCTNCEKLLGTDISATNHGLPQGKREMKYSGCLSGMVGKQCGFKWHSDSRLSRLMLRTFTVYAHIAGMHCTVTVDHCFIMHTLNGKGEIALLLSGNGMLLR